MEAAATGNRGRFEGAPGSAAEQSLRTENRQLRFRVRRQERENSTLRAAVTRLKQEVARLKTLLEEARRAAKRPAAPFSKGPPKEKPRQPGRKPGKAYGRKPCRPIPRSIDEVVEAPLPEQCPHCEGPIEETSVQMQYQTDIPERLRAKTTEFRVHMGRCVQCRRCVQGRHPQQTSDALGAAANQIGPQALALAAHLNKQVGVTHGRLVSLFDSVFGLQLAKATVVRGIERLARQAQPLYEQIRRVVRGSPVVYPDETSWRMNGRLYWLWDFVCASATLYAIRDSRGYDVLEDILGAAYGGVVGHDGWAPYDRLKQARHQTCTTHLLRRCRELLEMASGRAACFPRQVQALLWAGLALRDRRDQGIVSVQGLAVARGRLEARLDRLLYQTSLLNPENIRLANHLEAHQHQVFTYLWIPGVEASNWPAEQELRPAVVTRKISAGNRSPLGSHAQQILMSVLRTCVRHGRDPVALLVRLQRAATPQQRPRFRFPLAQRSQPP
ncbi:MAG: IS66 family transposase [bacterium]